MDRIRLSEMVSHYKSLVALGLVATALTFFPQLFTHPQVNSTLSEPTPTKSEASSMPLSLSTDWKICTEIQEGEGMFPALQRAAGGQTPRENRGGAVNQLEHWERKPNRVKVYGYEQTLKENPRVQPGDIVCDTNRPYLSDPKNGIPRE